MGFCAGLGRELRVGSVKYVAISALNQEREHPQHLAVDDFTIPVSADMLTEMERTGYRMARAREDSTAR